MFKKVEYGNSSSISSYQYKMRTINKISMLERYGKETIWSKNLLIYISKHFEYEQKRDSNSCHMYGHQRGSYDYTTNWDQLMFDPKLLK